MADATAVRERPILFSGEMVRAILDGRKTQTRRVIRIPDLGPGRVGWWGYESARDGATAAVFGLSDSPAHNSTAVRCPSGAPGDRLWVREAWAVQSYTLHNACGRYTCEIGYRADDAERQLVLNRDESLRVGRAQDRRRGHWRPSIHMPRWASRLTLEITDVRVERLQDISEADCRAEGCRGGPDSIPGYRFSATPTEHYRHLWNELNAHRGYGWDANPWVWRIEFRRIDQ